ncbi:hypothetical protein LTR72_005872 [Exophiala xenobiotica]|nr:hypothetical protein LTR72_005872 [Exophiala xenobiotica]KAK5297145.1 hypothetical protein LTR14_002876 [Exophiala xenobiotica]KAK5328368.1 hypothetical protein LTR93_002153 [Exophiala xenobiotica]KAK5486036.1 hypothetical protein LTR55_005714 [Exophiala xenobiotica]
MASEDDTNSEAPFSNPLFQDEGPLKDPHERRTIFAALDSFHQYRKNTHYNTTHRRRQNLYALPSAQWQMLANPPFSLLDTLNAIDDAIDHNADLADEILRLGLDSFGLEEKPQPPVTTTTTTTPSNPDLNWQGKAKPNDLSKAHSTIRQFYRDWSHEGFTLEVKPLLDTIYSDLSALLPLIPRPPSGLTDAPAPAPAPDLLLPGAGLGRLVFELSRLGYNATGNEISYHQLLASNFILNCTQHADQYPIYPFVNTFTNITSRQTQVKRHTIPDVHPYTAISSRIDAGQPVGAMNMTAGDFILSYSTPECRDTFDAVVTVFFIDTAPNLIRYVDTVWNCLKTGGIWINTGPLLWHFDDRVHAGAADKADDDDGDAGDQNKDEDEDKGIAEPGSFELSNDEVLQLITRLGFEVVRNEILGHDHDHPASAFRSGLGYMQDPSSLLQNRYRCTHWVARKKAKV